MTAKRRTAVGLLVLGATALPWSVGAAGAAPAAPAVASAAAPTTGRALVAVAAATMRTTTNTRKKVITTFTTAVPAAETYVLRLHLAPRSGLAGRRSTWNVIAEGRTVASAVTRKPGVLDIPVAVTDSNLNVSVTALRGQAPVSSVEVLRRPTGPAVPVAGRSQPVEAYGAVGDGRTDDTAALQRAFDTVPTGTTLTLTAGRTYPHSDVLHLRRPGTRLTGTGTLLATREDRSSVWIEADNITLEDLTLTITPTSRRWEAWEQMRLRAVGHTGLVLRGITIDGAAAAGIYLGGASNFTLYRVTVRNTRSDGIHMTSGSNNGQVLRPTVTSSGDDGIAVISYEQDGTPAHNITITSPTVLGTTWGRGISVVGGTNITYTDVRIERSSAAAIYIGSEGAPWNTAPAIGVRVTGGTLHQSNTSTNVDHGAIVILSAGRLAPRDIHLTGLTITNTRPTAGRDVGVITYNTTPSNITLDNFTITSTGHNAYSGNTDPRAYALTRWTVNGQTLPDHKP